MRRVRMTVPLLLAAALPWGVACSADDAEPGRAPVIEDARPAAARPGQRVTLVGRNFGLPGPLDRVTLGGADVAVESWADRALLVTVPALGPGVFDFVVRNGDRVSGPLPFEVRGAADAGPTVDLGVGDVAP